MIISRGTTPTLEIKFPLVISNYSDILITFAQDKQIILEKAKSDLTLVKDTTYSITLTENEINEFHEGIFDCQVRLVQDDNVAASKIFRARIEDVLNDTVLGD